MPASYLRSQTITSFISFKPGSSASELEAVTTLQDCILDIKTWMTADKLKLNDDKTDKHITVQY